MPSEGTLIMSDGNGNERRVACSGGLDTALSRDGDMRIYGVVNVKGDDLEAARQVMAQAQEGESPVVRYSGEVYTEDRSDKRQVDELELRIEAIDETGNVHVESDGEITA